MRFLRHYGIYQSDVVHSNPSPKLKPPPPVSDSRLRPENMSGGTRSLIVPMSSGRLFLDRVGRHQSPSLLHRRDQINMHFSGSWVKGDISTLLRRGHFYFALTSQGLHLTMARTLC